MVCCCGDVAVDCLLKYRERKEEEEENGKSAQGPFLPFKPNTPKKK